MDPNNIAMLALQIALGVIQLATFLLTKRTIIQNSMRPPPDRDDDDTPPRPHRREPPPVG
jgi:hypothetical protein